MKKVLLSVLFLLAGLFAFAQGAYKPVWLSINSENGIYAKGDVVKVTATVAEDAENPLLMQVFSYGKVISKKELTLPVGDSVIYEAECDGKASVMVKLGPASDPKNVTSVGYLVSPEEFRPGFKTPDDLREYWDGRLKVLRKCKPKVQTFPAEGLKEGEADGFECYQIEINMPSGNPCRGYVAYPKGAEKKSLPIYLYVHAAGVNRPHCYSRASMALKLAKKGCIALDINAHGFLNDQPQSYYDDLNAGELKDYSTREFTSEEDYCFHNMYLRDVRALDYAVTLPCWDGKRIMVRGESQGGGQSLALSGIDRRVTHCCATVPAITDTGGCLDGRKCGWPSSTNNKFAPTNLGQFMMAYHDGAILVSLFKGKLWMEAGNIDMTCDPAAVSAGYNNAGAVASKEIRYYPWRSHTKMDPRNNKDWHQKVEKDRNAFIDAFFKGE